jgi:hypothetical protein
MRVCGGFGVLDFFHQFFNQVIEAVVPVYVWRHDATAASRGGALRYFPAKFAFGAHGGRLEAVPHVAAGALPVRPAIGLPVAAWAINLNGIGSHTCKK